MKGASIMDKNIKGKIMSYYGGIAKSVNSTSKASCRCGTACCGDISNNSSIYTKEYLEGLPEDAVNVYTKEIIEDIAAQKNLGHIYSQIDSKLLDGAYAGAHVKAYK